MSSIGGEATAADAKRNGARRGRTISREQIAGRQRARIVRAAVEVVAEKGFGGATTTGVIDRAGVSRATFYEHFENFEDCFLAVLDEAMRRSTAVISAALQRGGGFPEQVVSGLVALLGFLDADPPLARVCLVEALAAGPAALEYRARELEMLKHMVDAAAAAAAGERQVSMMSAEAVVAAVAGLLHTRIVRGEAPPFVDLLSPLVGVVLTPYLDARTVAREVERARGLAQALAEELTGGSPAPTTGVAIPHGLANPRAQRARLCLLHLADNPGASNRAIAEAIGVPHRGQISKLLARLAREGLLVKRAGAPGHVNAWRLTPRGEQVAQALEEYR